MFYSKNIRFFKILVFFTKRNSGLERLNVTKKIFFVICNFLFLTKQETRKNFLNITNFLKKNTKKKTNIIKVLKSLFFMWDKQPIMTALHQKEFSRLIDNKNYYFTYISLVKTYTKA